MTPNEQWVPVFGYEDLYEVSDQGRVRSVPRTFTRLCDGRPVQVEIQGKILAQVRRDDGHMQVQLPRKGPDGRQHNSRRSVHVVMLESFVGERPPGRVSRHLNDIPDDNRLENLCWGTPSENRQDSVRNGTHGYAKRTHCKNGHEFTPENTFSRKGGARGCRACRRDYKRYKKANENRQRRREYMRGYRARQPKAKKPPRSECKYGHEYTPENTYIDGKGKRHCRQCRRAADKNRRLKST